MFRVFNLSLFQQRATTTKGFCWEVSPLLRFPLHWMTLDASPYATLVADVKRGGGVAVRAYDG